MSVFSVSNNDGTLVISPTSGFVVGSLNLNHPNTWTALQTFRPLSGNYAFAVPSQNASQVTTNVDSPYFEVLGSYWNGMAGVPFGFRFQTHNFITTPYDTVNNAALRVFYNNNGVIGNALIIVIDGGNNNGHGTVAIGQDACSKWNGNQFLGDVAIGPKALMNDIGNGGGASNIGIGFEAFTNNIDGQSNTGTGIFVGHQNVHGNFNAYYGEQTGFWQTGSFNAFFGRTSGYGQPGSAGSYNAGLGHEAGHITQGSRSVFLGAETGWSNLSGSGVIMIGYSAGYYDLGSNHLWIWNQTTGTLAGDLTHALVYGIMDASPANQSVTFNARVLTTQFIDMSNAADPFGSVGIGGSSGVNIKFNAGIGGAFFININGAQYLTVSQSSVQLYNVDFYPNVDNARNLGTLPNNRWASVNTVTFNASQGQITNPPAFAAGDKYMVMDANGNVHKSSQGPSS